MKNISAKWFTVAVIGVVLTGLLVTAAINEQWLRGDAGLSEVETSRKEKESRKRTAMATIPEGYVEIGGVHRPETDVKRGRDASPKVTPAGYHPGNTPVINPDTNKNTQSVVEAQGKPELAYRFSSMQTGPKFDLASYRSDPQAYLDEVAPGRINQTLPPANDVAAIQRVGKYIYDLIQGESCKLKVKIQPGMPVTFHSGRLGQFDNQLSSITVAANDDGIAEVNFRLTPGTQGEIDVRAASPVHSDLARWLVIVNRPEKHRNVNPSPSGNNK